jgi:serine phosphatase RsbU (regulator of sigma subunit)
MGFGKIAGQAMAVPRKLKSFLDGHNVACEVVNQLGEPVRVEIIDADGQRVMAVFPADLLIDIMAFARCARAVRAELTTKEESGTAALTPFGNLNGMKVYVDRRLTTIDDFIFTAGVSSDTLRMAYADYARIVDPIVAEFAVAPSAKPSSIGMDSTSSLPEMPWFSQEQLNKFSEFLTGDAMRDQRNIQALLGTVSEAVGETELEALLTKLVDQLIRSTGSERCILLLYSEGRLRVRLARDHRGNDLGTGPPMSRRVPRAVALEGKPIQIRVSSTGDVLDLTESVYAMRLRQVMCAPLMLRGRMLGVVYVDSTVGGPEHSPADLMLFNTQAGLMAMVIENNRLFRQTLETREVRDQLRVARDIQRRLLPDKPTTIAGVQLAGVSEPFERVGGDYFDYFPLGRDRVGLAVADVSGHGIGPALIMSDVRAHVRCLLQSRGSLGGLYGDLNRALYSDLGGDMFVTLFVAVFDRTRHQLEFQTAGHPPPFVYRPSTGTFQSMSSNAPALGFDDEISAGPCPSLTLSPGDYIVCYTDGVTETRRDAGKMYGEERLKEIIRHGIGGDTSPAELVDAVKADLDAFRGGRSQTDDVTLLVARV